MKTLNSIFYALLLGSVLIAPLGAQEVDDDAAEEAADAAEDAAEDAVEAAEEAAEEAADAAEEAAEEAAEAAEEAAEEAADAAEEAAEEAQEAAEEAREAAEEAEEEAREAAEEAEEEREKQREDNVDDDGQDESSRSPITRALEIGLDDDGQEIQFGEKLLLLDAVDWARLQASGFEIVERNDLSGFDKVLVRIAAAGADIDRELEELSSGLSSVEADDNHVYRPSFVQREQSAGETAYRPASFISRSIAARTANRRIGLIDTSLDVDHPALAARRVKALSFVERGTTQPQVHGTAVASILVGRTRDFEGLVPEAQLFAASVFVSGTETGVTTTAADLVRALDWMIKEQVPIVNMSLSGPPNAILQAAIKGAQERGMVIVAAAGNVGPTADPVFPAAYPGVIAVTAVGPDNRNYRLAGRGPHIEFSAPGVNVITARAGTQTFALQSGTSFAAPFVAAAILLECETRNGRCKDFRRQYSGLVSRSLDLGAKGRDDVYGYGLIRP